MSAQPAPPTETFEIRRLSYSDLPQVIAIERRSFPTPWSLAMFVLELSKPSGVCLAATIDDALVGYLVCSRYDRVWHLMNVAVDPGRRPLGQRAQRRHARELAVESLREAAGGGDADAQPGEGARAEPDGHPTHLLGGQAGLLEDRVDEDEKLRGVARPLALARVVALLEQLGVVAQQAHHRRRRGGVEPEQVHGAWAQTIRRESAPRCSIRTSTVAGGSTPAARSGHSTNATVSASR